MEVGGQVVRIGFCLLPCEFQGSNSGQWAWHQVSSNTEPSCWPNSEIYKRMKKTESKDI